MNLYDFIDNWGKSYSNPKNYAGSYSHVDYVSGLKEFASIWLKDSISDELLHTAVKFCNDCINNEKNGRNWKASSLSNKLREIDMGPAVFEGYSLNPDEIATAKKMLHSGVHIISGVQAREIFDSKDSKGKYHSPAVSLLQIDEKDGMPPVFVAIDNQSGDAWTEEFKTLEGAAAWLDGLSFEEVQDRYPDERPDKSLQDLCDEPIVGEAMLGGIRVVVDSSLTDITYNEAACYIESIEKQKQDKFLSLTEVFINPADGDNVALDWTLKPPKFQRIRRITGYLVGDLDRWNSAKLAEEHDRVKHVDSNTLFGGKDR